MAVTIDQVNGRFQHFSSRFRKGQAGGSMDAANILKPALARGAIRLIGATTGKEYRQTMQR